MAWSTVGEKHEPELPSSKGRLFVINEFDDESDRNTRRVDVGHLLSLHCSPNDSPQAWVNPVFSILRNRIENEKKTKERERENERGREKESRARRALS